MNLFAPDSPLLRQVLEGNRRLKRESQIFSPRAAADEDMLAAASEHEERRSFGHVNMTEAPEA